MPENRYLVIELAFLGDVIVSLALAAELRRLDPTGFITYLVRPESRSIVEICPDVDQALVYDKYSTEGGSAGIDKKASELNAIGFDTVILLHGSARSQKLCSLLNCKSKIGFSFMTESTLTARVEDTGWISRYERSTLPLKSLFDSSRKDSLPRLAPKPVAQVDEFRAHFATVVAIAPGSVWSTKKWGDDKYFELAKRIVAEGWGVIVIGGAEEEMFGVHVVAELGTSILNLAGSATIAGSASAIQAADLLVANDSAPSHIGVATRTKVISIFGPTVPEFGFAPPTPIGIVVENHDLWCRPCSSHGGNECPIHTHECMKSIQVADVWAKLKTELVPAR